MSTYEMTHNLYLKTAYIICSEILVTFCAINAYQEIPVETYRSFAKLNTTNTDHPIFVHMLTDLDVSYALHRYFFLDNNTLDTIDALSLSRNLTQCSLDLVYVWRNLIYGDNPWAHKMIDAFGKPGSGLMEGNHMRIGSYHECTNVYAPSGTNAIGGDFRAQYCSININTNPGSKNKNVTATWGICLPESCNIFNIEDDLKHLLNLTRPRFFVKNNAEFLFEIKQRTCQPNTRQLTFAAVCFICCISIFIVLAIIGTLMTIILPQFKKQPQPRLKESYNLKAFEISSVSGSEAVLTKSCDKNDDHGLIKKILSCFCLLSNGKRLLKVSTTDDSIPSLHGIRFFSINWIIICHTYAFSLSYVENESEMIELVDHWSFMVILNGGYCAVDAFFFMSGLLVAHVYLKNTAVTESTNWLYFYFHRFLRIMPAYLFVLGFYTLIYPYLGSGPFWPVTGNVEPICQAYWWLNILFINNFNAAASQCMSWSWYLSTDMQFYVISPILLVSLRWWGKVGWAVLVFTFIATTVVGFGITYYYNLFTGLGNFSNGLKHSDIFYPKFANYFNKLYVKPYSRIAPYLFGIALVYILFQKREKNNGTGKCKKHWLCCGWIVSAAISLMCIFGTYHRQQGLIESSVYNAFNHSVYSLMLAWVIFICLQKQGGIVEKILCLKSLIPLSRLTFTLYLVHGIVLYIYFFALKTPFTFSHFSVVVVYLGLLPLMYVAALMVSLIFEAPVVQLEKLLRKRPEKF